MLKPTLPPHKFEDDPTGWPEYWSDYAKHEKYVTNLNAHSYAKDYYKKANIERTKARRLAKLSELIELFPDEARLLVKNIGSRKPEVKADEVKATAIPTKYTLT